MHPYCYVQYLPMQVKSSDAPQQPMKVNWASGCNPLKVDTSRHFHVFVGDLCSEIDTTTLWQTFKKFGEVSDCKIIRDSATLKSKGYGFVTFHNREDAEYAIREMNGVQIGSKVVRTNWACRKTVPSNVTNTKEAPPGQPAVAPLSYGEVYKLTSESNTTVYVGGIPPDITEDALRSIFKDHGTILDVRLFGEKGYAFIKFSVKESAAKAIVNVNGTQYEDRVIKCFWGKEVPPSDGLINTNSYNSLYTSYPSTDVVSKMPTIAQLAYQYYQPMSYNPQLTPVIQNPVTSPLLHQQTYQQMYYPNWVNVPVQPQVQPLSMQYTTTPQQQFVFEMPPPTAGYPLQ